VCARAHTHTHTHTHKHTQLLYHWENVYELSYWSPVRKITLFKFFFGGAILNATLFDVMHDFLCLTFCVTALCEFAILLLSIVELFLGCRYVSTWNTKFVIERALCSVLHYAYLSVFVLYLQFWYDSLVKYPTQLINLNVLSAIWLNWIRRSRVCKGVKKPLTYNHYKLQYEGSRHRPRSWAQSRGQPYSLYPQFFHAILYLNIFRRIPKGNGDCYCLRILSSW
jgi:hypothetical protein